MLAFWMTDLTSTFTSLCSCSGSSPCSFRDGGSDVQGRGVAVAAGTRFPRVRPHAPVVLGKGPWSRPGPRWMAMAVASFARRAFALRRTTDTVPWSLYRYGPRSSRPQPLVKTQGRTVDRTFDVHRIKPKAGTRLAGASSPRGCGPVTQRPTRDSRGPGRTREVRCCGDRRVAIPLKTSGPPCRVATPLGTSGPPLQSGVATRDKRSASHRGNDQPEDWRAPSRKTALTLGIPGGYFSTRQVSSRSSNRCPSQCRCAWYAVGGWRRVR